MNRRVWLWFAWSHKYHFQDSARKIWLILRVDGQSRWKTNEVRCKIYNPSWSLYNKPIGAKGGGGKYFSATMKSSVLKGIRDTPCSTPAASCKPFCKVMCGHAPLKRVQTRWLLLVVWAKLFFIKQPLFSEFFFAAQCSQFAKIGGYHNISNSVLNLELAAKSVCCCWLSASCDSNSEFPKSKHYWNLSWFKEHKIVY